ncbi:MAG: hypothetical protein RR425_06830 [Erysipelotrichales bacterium]
MPGINEAKDDNNINIISMFDNVLENSNQIIYLFDIQYYKASENVDILNRIKLYRQDLVNDILFVLTKIDIFNYDKGKTLDDTKDDIQRVLSRIGITKTKIIECSSKQSLIANNIEKAYKKDNNNFIYNLLNNSKSNFFKSLGKKISKAEKIVNHNSEYITQNVNLKRFESNGKSILALPEVDEIIQEMKLKSRFHNVVNKLQDIVNNASFIKAKTNNEIYELVNNDFERVINVLKEESQNEVDILISNDKLKKFKILESTTGFINEIEVYKQGNIKEEEIEMLLSKLVRDEMKDMKVKSYYDTEWYQYDNDVYDIKETSPGRYKENLEYEASCSYNRLITAIYSNIDSIMKDCENIIMDNAKKYVDEINNVLQNLYKENNINFNDKINLNIASNSISSIEVSSYFKPYVNYESKSVSSQVGWINKRTVYNRKFRICQVGEFKSQCMNDAEGVVMSTSRSIVEKSNVDLPNVINESIREQLNNHIEVINSVINDRKDEVNQIILKIEKFNKLISDLEECRLMQSLQFENGAEVRSNCN